MTSLDKKLAWVAKIVRAGMCLGSIISLAALAHPPANRHMPQNAATCGYVDFVVGRERLSVPEPLVRLEGRDYWNLSDWAPSQAPSQAPSGLKYNAVPPETYNIFASKGEGEKPPILGDLTMGEVATISSDYVDHQIIKFSSAVSLRLLEHRTLGLKYTTHRFTPAEFSTARLADTLIVVPSLCACANCYESARGTNVSNFNRWTSCWPFPPWTSKPNTVNSIANELLGFVNRWSNAFPYVGCHPLSLKHVDWVELHQHPVPDVWSATTAPNEGRISGEVDNYLSLENISGAMLVRRRSIFRDAKTARNQKRVALVIRDV
ncbi:hypothetical protein EDD16DRAFT_1766180 [Pisolithus croceorrhizus]|nr:hypothetical protein EDD16DRAFT_1766180 [Pisolithus croceorrhizus]KAI6100971.1 hypothetical protein EV401DRAFT_1894311 [Pisolithus croceorrhizus]